MNLKDILKFQFRRVNPFPGLAIDADTWRDAHNYSRDQQRLHNLIFHQTGIIEGLEVTENDPPDMSVIIHPGVAIDSEGNTIIVPNVYHYKIQNRENETIYLIIQFREILEGPYQPPEGGQPTRILDGYRIQERDNLPDEPHLELARIELDQAQSAIHDSENKLQPARNEINLTFRDEVKQPSVPGTSKAVPAVQPHIIAPQREILIGQAAVSDPDSSLHLYGLRNMARDLEIHYNWKVDLEESIELDSNIEKYTMIYITGGNNFKLNNEQVAALNNFIKSNGVILAEECVDDKAEDDSMHKNQPVYDELTKKLHCKLKDVHQGDDLLSGINVFSEIPQGVKSGIIQKNKNIIYSNNDYGCAWQGGHADKPLSRKTIRDAFEIGANIIDYAYRTKLSIKKKTLVLTR